MITLYPSLLIGIAILFLVTLFVLNKIFYQPFLTKMDERQKSFNDGESQIQSNDDEIKRLKQEANTLLRKAKITASEHMAEVVAKSNQETQKALDTRKAEIEQEIASFEQELKTQAEELKNALLGQAPLFKEGLKIKLAS